MAEDEETKNKYCNIVTEILLGDNLLLSDTRQVRIRLYTTLTWNLYYCTIVEHGVLVRKKKALMHFIVDNYDLC